MMTYEPTGLDVGDPWPLAEGDVETFAFDAQEAIASATVALVRIDTFAAAGSVSVDLSGTVVRPTVSGLTNGVVYQLRVRFKTAANREWTRTLGIPCVA